MGINGNNLQASLLGHKQSTNKQYMQSLDFGNNLYVASPYCAHTQSPMQCTGVEGYSKCITTYLSALGILAKDLQAQLSKPSTTL